MSDNKDSNLAKSDNSNLQNTKNTSQANNTGSDMVGDNSPADSNPAVVLDIREYEREQIVLQGTKLKKSTVLAAKNITQGIRALRDEALKFLDQVAESEIDKAVKFISESKSNSLTKSSKALLETEDGYSAETFKAELFAEFESFDLD